MKLTTFVKQVKREYLAESKRNPTYVTYLCPMASRTDYKLATRYFPAYDFIRESLPYEKITKQVKTQIKLRINRKYTVRAYLASQNMDSSLAAQHKFRLALLEDLLDWAAEIDNCTK